MFGFAAQLVWSSIRYRVFYTHGRRDNNGGIVVVVFMIAIILWLGYLATLLMRFALSRHREYMADAGAIELTRNPEAMMRALCGLRAATASPDHRRHSHDVHRKPRPVSRPVRHAPADRGQDQSDFRNHRNPVPELPHTGPAPKEEAFAALKEQGERPNPWLTRGRRI